MVTPSSATPSDVARLQRQFAVRALALALLLGITGEMLLTILAALIGLGLLVLSAE
ncbi:hypothetical protein AB0I53_26850 [Saccharopolyspora sp. NPDC050389]|uniref:hypothetical protein n=1 Tax=Saccharopolyspora sp. NPDC050389 TaxID=3155516 RepID=UPI0033E93F68